MKFSLLIVQLLIAIIAVQAQPGGPPGGGPGGPPGGGPGGPPGGGPGGPPGGGPGGPPGGGPGGPPGGGPGGPPGGGPGGPPGGGPGGPPGGGPGGPPGGGPGGPPGGGPGGPPGGGPGGPPGGGPGGPPGGGPGGPPGGGPGGHPGGHPGDYCPEPLIPKEQCGPSYTTTEVQCRDRIRRCFVSYGIELKWTGTGSPHINGHAQGDGGCQCKEYCGYFTKGPCNRDPKCIWATEKGVCFHRHPNYPGHPIDPCPCKGKCCWPRPGRWLRGEQHSDEEQLQLEAPEEVADDVTN